MGLSMYVDPIDAKQDVRDALTVKWRKEEAVFNWMQERVCDGFCQNCKEYLASRDVLIELLGVSLYAIKEQGWEDLLNRFKHSENALKQMEMALSAVPDNYAGELPVDDESWPNGFTQSTYQLARLLAEIPDSQFIYSTWW